LYQSARGSVREVYNRLAEGPPRDSDDLDGLRRDLLGSVARYYDEFIATNRDEPDTLADVAEARTRSAMIARAAGRDAEAAAQFREAIDLWRDLIAASPAAGVHRERLARAWAELGRSLDSGGKGAKPDDALAAFEAARGLLTSLADARPDARGVRRELARVLRDEAEIQDRRDRPEAADALLRQAILLQEELGWENAHDLEARLALASNYGFMARLEARGEAGRSGARGALERAVEVLTEAPEAGSVEPPPRLALETAERLVDLANVERMDDAPREAVGHADRAVALLEALTARRPTELAYQKELATAYNLVGELRRNARAFDSALEAARKAQGLLDRLIREQPGDPRHPVALATTHQLIGRTLAQSRKYADALQSFQSAVDLLEGQADLDAASHYNLASTLSLAHSLIGARDGTPPPDDVEKLGMGDKIRRKLYADRAMQALRQAVADGFNRVEIFRTDPALDSLRPRDDFQKLVADLAAKP
jgi:tetratricopeptide (TPR) repeat protein